MKVIVDTDPGVDDALALLLLLASPEVSIELITVTFGNTALDRAFLNVLKIYNVARQHLASHTVTNGHKDAIFPNLTKATPTLLARGAAGPIQGALDLAEYFHGPDGLSDITNTHPHFGADVENPDEALSIIDTPAEDAILALLATEPPNTVTILTLGPFTNIARAYQKNPEVFKRVAEVVSMGGALDAPGNTSPSAEFNVFADPFGAEIVLRGATEGQFKLVLLPLDITTQHTIPFNKLIHTSSSSVLHAFTDAILSRTRLVLRDFGIMGDTFDMHDPLAAYYVIDKATAHAAQEKPRWIVQKRQFLIERTGEWTKGMCVVDRRGTLEVAGAVRSQDGITTEDNDEARKPEALIQHGLNVSVVVGTPGAPIFEELFLARVCGTNV